MAEVQSGAFTQAGVGVASARRIDERVAELGLQANADQLDSVGYTVVDAPAPLELFDRIREAIVRVTAETRARGVEPFNFGPNTSMMYRLLVEDDVFVEAVLNPKLTALMSYLLGDGYLLSVATGSVLSTGARHGPLHADNQFFPEPFPEQVQVATAIWCCDDFSGENGSTQLVPGSQRLARHPRPGEAKGEVVAVDAPRGSIVIWTGHTWHRSGGRTAPGDRVALHTAFARPHLKVFEAYRPDEVDRLVGRDERFRRLLGADLPFDYDDMPDPMKILALAQDTQARA
jgi:ectoine hydroxylase-related dioxygenase (phytanoyl-CoA dioxygenase family)